MKKLLYICLFVGLGIVHQNTVSAQGFLGAEAGVNFANLNGEDIDSETRVGLMAGVFYRMMLASGPFYLQPELLYSQKGLDFSNDVTFALDYLTLNVLLAYYVASTGLITPFFKLGPYIAFNVNAKRKFEDDTQGLDGVNSTDVGVIARAGVQINRFEIGGRLAQGLSNVFDNDNSDAKNFVFGFFVGLHL